MKENREIQRLMKENKPTVIEILGAMTFGILTIIMLLQGSRLWSFNNTIHSLDGRLHIIETKVEILRETQTDEFKHKVIYDE